MKNIFYLCIGLILLGSCKSAKSVTSIASLNGEWSIVELNSIATGENDKPVITFNVTDRRISAKAGCNNISGAFEYIDDKSKAVSFKRVVATRMFCLDMSREEALIKAIDEVDSFDVIKGAATKQSYVFKDEEGKILFVIERNK